MDLLVTHLDTYSRLGIPKLHHLVAFEAEDEVDPAWPHLQGIYEFFLQLVINEAVEVRSLKVYVTP